ncbi:hypothetical protein AGMMS49992_23580 [Clostridia bacterium]|nr:hypothetical protein AGMMS49992_23580 [Clostridia bacterium]
MNFNISTELPIETNYQKYSIYILPIYIVLKPFYFAKSGLPQISDIFLFITYFFYDGNDKFKLLSRKLSTNNIQIAEKILLALVSYIVAINVFFYSTTGNNNFSLIRRSIYYIFNYFAFIYSNRLLSIYKTKLTQYTFYATAVSILIQLGSYQFGGGFNSKRAIANFNNPNQLGYYSLVASTIIIIAYYRTINTDMKYKRLALLLSLLSTTYLSFCSLSKAAIVAQLFLVGIVIGKGLMHINLTKLVLIIIVALFMIYAGMSAGTYQKVSETKLYISVIHRLQDIGKSDDDSIEGRGYDRIIDYPNYIYCGAGEGEFIRFGRSMEIHSTIANMLFSYGIIGSALFYSFLLRCIKYSKCKDLYIIIAFLIYGIAHNGTRNIMMWVAFSFLSYSEGLIEEDIGVYVYE